jgi:hypothetical protein
LTLSLERILIQHYLKTISYKLDALMLPVSSSTDNGARQRRHTLHSRGGFIAHSLGFTIVALLTVHIQEVLAFLSNIRVHGPAIQNVKAQNIQLFCVGTSFLPVYHVVKSRNNNKESFFHHTQRLTVAKMSTKDDDIATQQTNFAVTNSVNETNSSMNGSSRTINRSSLSRTLVLAVPLMLKFVLVLMIKFLTDLVVFPLLFTYRGTRVMKRRIFKIWNRWTSSATSTTVDTGSNEEVTLNLENYVANGSSPIPNSSRND